MFPYVNPKELLSRTSADTDTTKAPDPIIHEVYKRVSSGRDSVDMTEMAK